MTTEQAPATAPTPAPVAARRQKSPIDHLIWAGDRFGTLAGFLAMIALFCILRPDTFATIETARSIGESAAPLVVLGVGLTIVMSTGQFDLSFPGIIGIAAAGAVLLMSDNGVAVVPAVIAAIAIGLVTGLIAGILVSTGRASSFIVTLALSTIWTGLAIGFSDSRTITGLPRGYTNITFNTVWGVPNAIIIALVVSILGFALLRWTVFGRYAQVLGSNTDAARLAGIRVSRTLITAFVLLGLCASITAIIISSSSGQFSPQIGSGILITPFVAVFFGTSVLAARRFNVFGTVIGTLFIGTLQTGMVILDLEPWVAEVILGGALIIILVPLAKRTN